MDLFAEKGFDETTIDDIAKAAVFLASPDASYITGQVLTVDGGLSLGAVANP